jgi:hypothetical protein
VLRCFAEHRTEKTHGDMEVNIPAVLDLLDLNLQVIEHTVFALFVICDFYVTRHRIVELDGSSRNQMKTVTYKR